MDGSVLLSRLKGLAVSVCGRNVDGVESTLLQMFKYDLAALRHVVLGVDARIHLVVLVVVVVLVRVVVVLIRGS